MIDIIRYDDDPKAALMREDWGRGGFVRATSERDYVSPRLSDGEGGLTEVQSEAVLNMRLRSLRRLEEIELRKEYDALLLERAGLEDLLADDKLQWGRIAEELREVRKAFGRDTPGGARRTNFADAAETPDIAPEDMIEREPVTVILSRMGWVRAMKGHIAPETEVKFKDGDGPGFQVHAETTDKVLVFASTGRFYTLSPASLPGGRGMGEPLRLMIDLPNEAEVVALMVHRADGKLIVASTDGDGFIVPEAEVVAQTRAGKQVLNLSDGAKAAVCRPVEGDHVAVVSKNRRLIVFPLAELPEMTRGKGVRLQKYNMVRGRQGVLELDGGLSDLTTFQLAEGLAWAMPNGQTRRETGIADWVVKRGGVGKQPPHGFPRDNRFT